MRKCDFFVILFFFVISLTMLASLSAATRGISVVLKEGRNLQLYKSYHALVVGISNYEKWPNLPYAVSDAREVAHTLRELGFEVKLVLNPDSSELKMAIQRMTYGAGREPNRAILFYYAGHGETETMADGTKMGYIVPKDCPLLKKSPIGFATHAISMREIESASLRIRAKHVLMLFDSCFSGALFSLIRAVPHDITEKSALPVRQYITAGREDEEVPDRSMFKRCFLIGLKGHADMTGDGYITGSEMGMYLADNVVNYAHKRQHPQYGKINNPDLDQGDFIFVPLKTLNRTNRQKDLLNEQDSLFEDIAELKADRVKTRQLLEEMKKLLQDKSQVEEQKGKTSSEKKKLERQVVLLAKESEKRKELEKELERERLKNQQKKPIHEAGAVKIGTSDSIAEMIKDAEKKRIATTERQKVESFHTSKVNPQQNTTTLIVNSNVKNAKVYIDKNEISFWASPDEAWIFRGEVPFKLQGLSRGKHLIRVHKKGYVEEVEIINISPGEVLELDITLLKSENIDYGGGGGGGGQ